MAITINGTGTISGLSVGGLPDGSVDADTLASGAVTTNALPAGSILQVVSTSEADVETISSTSWTDTGLTATITPSSTSSKILVLVDITYGGSNNAYYNGRVLAGSGVAGRGPSDGSRVRASFTMADNDQSRPRNTSHNFLHSPSTTNAVTYKVQVLGNSSQGVRLNTSWENENSSTTGVRAISNITLLEIGG